MTEKIIKGKRPISKLKKFIPQIRPATTHPTGIVTMPQIIPKNISLCCSFFTMLTANGIVNDTTHPIIEETTNALNSPMVLDLQTAFANVMPPISLAKREAGIIDGSILNTE